MKVKNRHLNDMAEFLQNSVTAKGMDNVHRMRVVKSLKERNDEVAEEEFTLVKEFAVLDEKGEPKQLSAGNFEVKNPAEFTRQQQKLLDEYFHLDAINLKEPLETVKRLVLECDIELSGIDAEMHYTLMEQYGEDDKDEVEN